MMLVAYGSISLALGILALPFVILGAAVSSRWRQGLGQRLGAVERSSRKDRLLIQLASVGEVISARPLVKALVEKLGLDRVVLSTMTPTGNDEARKSFPGLQVVFFPADFGPAPYVWLSRLGISRVLLFETELWPVFLLTCRAMGIPVGVVNARISDKSFPRYRALKLFLSPLLARLSFVGAQTEEYRNRLVTLGVPSDRCVVTGNLKFDISETRTAAPEFMEIMKAFMRGRRLLIFASTHEGEEDAALSGLAVLFNKYDDAIALIAPRHKERFEAVWAKVRAAFPNACRRSDGTPKADSRLILLDTLGELSSCFEFGYAAFMGGSLTPVGGHNVLEPARAGIPVIVGPHTENFRAETELLHRASALHQIHDVHQLALTLDKWLADPDAVKSKGSSARRVILENQGALHRTFDLLASSGFLG